MRRNIFAAVVAAAFGVGGLALGHGHDRAHPTGMKDSSQQSMRSQHEITGRLLRAGDNNVFIEHMGLVVPIQVSASTAFDPGTKSARDLTEGQDVRVAFTVENGTSNVAQSIHSTAIGGSGEPNNGPSGISTQGTRNPGSSGTSATPSSSGTHRQP